MSDTVLDRAKAQRPTPKPGILDIACYVPGKAKVEGVEHPLKLSANENILGCSPDAKVAFTGAIDQLHMYPDGRTTILRTAIAEKYGSDLGVIFMEPVAEFPCPQRWRIWTSVLPGKRLPRPRFRARWKEPMPGKCAGPSW